MQAITYTQYGSSEVLRLTEIAKPTPADDEVLVKVYATSANPADWHLMRAAPFLARFANGLLKPKNTRLGADVSGRVEAVGRKVTQFHVGDAVFGSMPLPKLGGFAEYVCATEALLVLKPASTSFEAAAAVPLAASTALQGLRDKGHIQTGQTVLVNGASGGVGTFAVQIAKSYGTEVTGVCSTRNVAMVRSIGADHVIDYTKDDFTQHGQRYDLIFDAVGNRSVAHLRRALRPAGICAVAGFTSMARLLQVVVLGGKQIGLMATSSPNKHDLVLLQGLLDAGKIVPVIDRTYPLREVAKALAYLEAGHAQGKVVITVAQDSQA